MLQYCGCSNGKRNLDSTRDLDRLATISPKIPAEIRIPTLFIFGGKLFGTTVGIEGVRKCLFFSFHCTALVTSYFSAEAEVAGISVSIVIPDRAGNF
jgi:hypothetical protein